MNRQLQADSGAAAGALADASAARAALTTGDGPYYRPVGREIEVFEHADRNGLPLLLKGPTGSGKSRFVERMAWATGRELITVACNDETSAVDLLGRYLVQGADTVWTDGPLTRGVRSGAIVYLDELAEARPDTIVAIHSLTDHRRTLFLDRRDETICAPPGFMLAASFNPGYQRGFKELKPSTRQRFVTLSFDYPHEAVEIEILCGETRIDREIARRLVVYARKIRARAEFGLAETVSTRLLASAARLIRDGLPARLACNAAIVQPLTDDPDIGRALQDLADLSF